MENYKEYRNKLFEAFMEAQSLDEGLFGKSKKNRFGITVSSKEEDNAKEYYHRERNKEEREAKNTVLHSWEKRVKYKGNSVIIDKRTGIIQHGLHKGEKVELEECLEEAVMSGFKVGDVLVFSGDPYEKSCIEFAKVTKVEGSKYFIKKLDSKTKPVKWAPSKDSGDDLWSPTNKEMGPERECKLFKNELKERNGDTWELWNGEPVLFNAADE